MAATRSKLFQVCAVGTICFPAQFSQSNGRFLFSLRYQKQDQVSILIYFSVKEYLSNFSWTYHKISVCEAREAHKLIRFCAMTLKYTSGATPA